MIQESWAYLVERFIFDAESLMIRNWTQSNCDFPKVRMQNSHLPQCLALLHCIITASQNNPMQKAAGPVRELLIESLEGFGEVVYASWCMPYYHFYCVFHGKILWEREKEENLFRICRLQESSLRNFSRYFSEQSCYNLFVGNLALFGSLLF